MQLQVETQIYKKNAIGAGINEAGTKADYYITYISPEKGIQVHNQYTQSFDKTGTPPYGNYVQINGDDISMWRANKEKMRLDATALNFYGYNDNNQHLLASYGNGLTLYKPGVGTGADVPVVVINSSGANIDGSVTIGNLNQSEYLNTNVHSQNFATGTMLYKDPMFITGVNNTVKYANNGASNISWARTEKSSDNPFDETSSEMICTNIGTVEPGLGGFYWGHKSRASAIFLYRIVAKIPIGHNIQFASNATGNNYTRTWLTSNKGTGKFTEYVFKLICGDTGTFSTTGYFYIDGTPGTASAPVVWRVAYASVYDMTKVAEVHNYITSINSDGIWVTPSGKKPTNTSTGAGATGTKIDGNGVGIYVNGVQLAQYGTTTYFYEPDGTTAATLNGDGLNVKTGTIKLGSKTSLTDANSGVYVGSDGIALGASSAFKVTSSGALTATSATFGGSNGITITSSKVTLGSNCKISWSSVDGTDDIANKTDIPTTAQITQISNNAISTATISANQINGGTITGITISGNTISGGSINIGNGKFSVDTNGKLTATGADIGGTLNAETGSTIGPWTVSNSAIYNGKTAVTNTTTAGVYLGTDGLNISGGTAATTAYITKSAVNIGNKLTWNGTTLSVNGAITATSLTIDGNNYASDIKTISGKATTGYVDTAKQAAEKTAINYIGISGNGIKVAASSPTSASNYVEINSGAVNIVADSTHKTTISSSGMNVYAGSSSAVAQFGSTITLGQASQTQIYINSTGADAGIKFITQYKDTSNAVKNFYLGDIGFDSTSGWTNNPTVDKGYFPVGAWATFGLRTIGSFNGYYSFVSGFDNVASHNASVSFGVRNKVYAPCGFAMGMDNIIGDSSKTSKNSYTTYDIGNCSTTIGYGLHTGNATDQFVCGRYNKIDTNCYFIVGGGYSDSRINSFAVTKNGRVQTTANGYESNRAQISVGIQYSDGFREEIWMGVGSGGDNKGLYDPVNNKWILFLKNTGSASQKISTSFGGFSTTSDLKRKNIIGPINYATDFIMSLKPKQYYWKDDKYKKINLGFVAQEVNQIGNKLNLDLNIALAQYKDKSKGEYHGGAVDDSELEWFLDYNEIIAPLVQVVQDQQKEIEQLKKEIKDLKNK